MRLFLIVVVITAFGWQLKSQNMAYIYRDSVVAATPFYIARIQKVDSLQKEYSQEIQGLREQLQANLNKLVAKYNPQENEGIESLKKRMSPQDTIMLNIIFEEDKILTSREKGYGEMLKQTYLKEIQPLIDQINKTIEGYARKNKIDMVLIMEEIGGGMAYINKSKNITGEIIKLLASN